MMWTRAWMQIDKLNNFRLLSPSKAAEHLKCFAGIDIDSFKII